MVRKSIFKNAIRQIKLSNKRFIFLIFTIALGIGFYVGIKTTPVSMENMAKDYYENTNLMDLKIVSNSGFSKSDIEEFKKIKEVKGVMLVKTLDTIATSKDKDFTIRLYSISKDRSKKNDDYINRLILTSGRYPSTINEGLVEETFLKDNNLKIGDLVSLMPEDKTNLRAKKIKIVGTVKNSYYSYNELKTTSLENKKIDYYMYIEENNFNTSYYTEGYITFKKKGNYNTYSNAYKVYIDKNKENILNLASLITNEKYEININEANNNINIIEENLNKLYTSQVPIDLLNDSIKELSDQLNNAKESLNKIPLPNTYVLTRNEIPSFYQYKLEIEKLRIIAKVFPLIFLLIEALISIIIIYKIIDDEKTEIGFLRAIGYNKSTLAFKYVLYTILASIIGSLLGSVLFYRFISTTLSACYSKFFEIPNLKVSFHANYAIFANVLTLLITILATLLTFMKIVNKTPVMLMNEEIPKRKKGILTKKINKIWEKLNLHNNEIFKNIFKYKKRLLVTIVLICGCTTLVLTALGVKDSINKTINNQFDKINKYDMSININSSISNDDLQNLENNLINNKNINQLIKIRKISINIKNKNINESAEVIIPEDENKINDFITLQNKKEKNKKLLLNADGIIISRKLSKLLQVKKNDKVTLIIEKKDYNVKIKDITENYIDNFIYMSPKTYEKITKSKNVYNIILTNNKKISAKEENELIKDITDNKYVLSCNLSSEIENTYKKSMISISYVTFILIVFTSFLLLIILYNILVINIIERKKDIVKIKILGFYDYEVTNYICKETIILTVIGAILGLITGSILTYFVIKIYEANKLILSFGIKFTSYLLSFLIIILFLIIVNIIMHFSLKKINNKL